MFRFEVPEWGGVNVLIPSRLLFTCPAVTVLTRLGVPPYALAVREIHTSTVNEVPYSVVRVIRTVAMMAMNESVVGVIPMVAQEAPTVFMMKIIGARP